MSSDEIMVSGKPLSSLRVVDLKEELEKRGLQKSGSKKDLVERLKMHLRMDKEREAVKAVGEEEIPNITMQNQLDDENPFIKEYLASQAQMYHSQREAKKMIEIEKAEVTQRSEETQHQVAVPLENNDIPKVTSKENDGKENKKLVNEAKGDKSEQVFAKKSIVKQVKPEVSREEITKSVNEAKEDVQKKKMTVVEVDSDHSQPVKDTMISENEPPAAVESSAPEVRITRQKRRGRSSSGSKSKVNSISEVAPVSEPASSDVNEKAPKDQEEMNDPDLHIGKFDDASSTTEVEKEKMASPSKESFESSDKNATNDDELIINAPITSDLGLISQAKIDEDEPLDYEEENNENNDGRRGFSPLPSSSPRVSDKLDDSGVEMKEGIEEVIKETGKNITRDKENLNMQNRDSKGSLLASKSSSLNHIEESEDIVEGTVDMEESLAPKEDEETVQTKKSNLSEFKSNRKKLGRRNIKTDVDRNRHDRLSPSKVTGSDGELPNKKLDSMQPRIEDDLDYGEEEKPVIADSLTWRRRTLAVKSKAERENDGTDLLLLHDKKAAPVVTSELLSEYYPSVAFPLEGVLVLEDQQTKTSTKERRRNSSSSTVSRRRPSDSGAGSVPLSSNKRKVSLIPMIEPQDDLDKELTPPRNPTSAVVIITNLVRPFTLPQLKELLQRTGNLVDLWVDKVKSKCIAKFEKSEEAFETRVALHGIKWPVSNPKMLSVDYTTEEFLESQKKKDTTTTTAATSIDQVKMKTEKPERKVELTAVREWDLGKRSRSKSPRHNRGRGESGSYDRERKRSKRSPSGRRHASRSRSRGRHIKTEKEEHVGKSLDELFKKTLATPCIYWLPLTAQQIAEKENVRRQRMLERDRRLAEMNRPR